MSDDKHYEVGYGKTPVDHRYKKGQSGNPKGRKKREKKNIASLFVEEAQKLVTVTINGKAVQITQEQCWIMRLHQMAMKGQMSAIKALATLRTSEKLFPVEQIPITFTLNIDDADDPFAPFGSPERHKNKKPNSDLSSISVESPPVLVPIVTAAAPMLLTASDTKRDEIVTIKVKRKVDLPKFKRKIPKHTELD